MTDARRRCTKCAQKKSVGDFYARKSSRDGLHTICKSCLAQAHKRYRAENHDRVKARKRATRAARSETELARERDRMRARHQANRDAAIADMRTRRLAVKLTVLRHYGPVCACCSESDSRFLTIEHANGDGAAHRREISGTRTLGADFYRWLIRNGLPGDLGLIVLCISCNQSGHHNGGVCPHATPDPAYVTSAEPELIRARIAWLERQLEYAHQSARPVASGASTVQS